MPGIIGALGQTMGNNKVNVTIIDPIFVAEILDSRQFLFLHRTTVF